MPFYAVRAGKIPGVYQTWPECQAQVNGFRGPIFKKFDTLAEASTFVNNTSYSTSSSSSAFYAVKSGRIPGIYLTWPECQAQVIGFRGAIYRKLGSLEAAHKFINDSPEFTGCVSHLPFDSFSDKPKLGDQQSTYSSDTTSSHIINHNLSNNLTSSPQPEFDAASYPPAGINGSTAIVYADGACISNGRAGASAGCGVYWGSSSFLNASEKVPGSKQTNNTGELLAIINALKNCPRNIKKLQIYSDSEYCINTVLTYRDAYIKNGFTRKVGNNRVSIPNASMINCIYKLIDYHHANVEFYHVRGHRGIPSNEEADKLAVKAAKLPPIDKDVDWDALTST